MACMYPRHFPNLPMAWDDPAWMMLENEQLLESTLLHTLYEARRQRRINAAADNGNVSSIIFMRNINSPS